MTCSNVTSTPPTISIDGIHICHKALECIEITSDEDAGTIALFISPSGRHPEKGIIRLTARYQHGKDKPILDYFNLYTPKQFIGGMDFIRSKLHAKHTRWIPILVDVIYNELNLQQQWLLSALAKREDNTSRYPSPYSYMAMLIQEPLS